MSLDRSNEWTDQSMDALTLAAQTNDNGIGYSPRVNHDCLRFV